MADKLVLIIEDGKVANSHPTHHQYQGLSTKDAIVMASSKGWKLTGTDRNANLTFERP